MYTPTARRLPNQRREVTVDDTALVLPEPFVWSRPPIQHVMALPPIFYEENNYLPKPTYYPILKRKPNCLQEPIQCTTPNNSPRFLHKPVRSITPNDSPRFLRDPACYSIPNDSPRLLREPACSSTRNGKPRNLQEPALELKPDMRLLNLFNVPIIETGIVDKTWASRLLELANKEFDSIPIYSSIPTNPHATPKKRYQVMLTVGKVCVTAEGASHSGACDEAAKKAIHVLTGGTLSENSQPEKETKAKIPASTNFPIQGIKELPDFKYSSSPILILQKVATMLSKSVAFSPMAEWSATPPNMRITCSFGDWSICGQGSNEASAKLASAKLMLSHLYRNNVYGINWPATINMLDGNKQENHSKIPQDPPPKPVAKNIKSPISRPYEFQSKKKEDEPLFEMISSKPNDKGVLEHNVQVTVGSWTAYGTGPTLKAARHTAALNAVETIASDGVEI